MFLECKGARFFIAGEDDWLGGMVRILQSTGGPIKANGPLGRNGEMDAGELYLLCALARIASPPNFFEFGTYMGTTALHLAMTRPDAKVFTMDAEDPPDRGRPQDAPYMAMPRDMIGMRFLDSPYANQVTQVWGDSLNYDFSPWYGQMGLVYVDGGHDYETALSDMENAYKMLHDPEDGIIVLHDMVSRAESVIEACITFTNRHPYNWIGFQHTTVVAGGIRAVRAFVDGFDQRND